MIQDSGNRTVFGTGAQRDISDGKGRCDLLPLSVVAEVLEPYYYEKVKVLKLIENFVRSGDILGLKITLGINTNQDIITTMLEVSVHYEEGAAKYSERNWELGLPVHSFIDSAIRHYLKWLRGDDDERHDRAFVWNILGAIWTIENHPELNEYPIKLEVK